jgi:hypothetical protein
VGTVTHEDSPERSGERIGLVEAIPQQRKRRVRTQDPVDLSQRSDGLEPMEGLRG